MTQARGQTALAIKNDHPSAEHPSEPVSLEMLKLDEGVSWAMLVSFAQDMFPRVSTEDIGVWPADGGELAVSVRGNGSVAPN